MVFLHELILMLHQAYKWGSDELGESCSSVVGNVGFWNRDHKLTNQLSQAAQCEAYEHWEIRGITLV